MAADSNGFFHPLGDHGQTTVAVDGQPVSDQQSKAFSTQFPVNALQSMEVMTGAVPAEFGDKTSLVVNAITRSGLGQHKPSGSFASRYGSFGTSGALGDFSVGADKMSGILRPSTSIGQVVSWTPQAILFLLHDRGTCGQFFDHFDYRLTPNERLLQSLILLSARNRFEIPNTIDQQSLGHTLPPSATSPVRASRYR